jgi:uncharacterized protein
MHFAQDPTSGVNLIRGYAPGEIRINEQRIAGGVIVSASTLLEQPELRVVADLGPEHVARILTLQPELVLLGSGARQIFPAASFSVQFLRAGIGFEVMDTPAACRTFNVLVAEQRRAVAVLFLV